MKKLVLLVALFGFLSSPTFAQKKHVVYHKHYKGKRYHKHYHRMPPAPPAPPRPILPPPPPRPPKPLLPPRP